MKRLRTAAHEWGFSWCFFGFGFLGFLLLAIVGGVLGSSWCGVLICVFFMCEKIQESEYKHALLQRVEG